MSGYTEKVITCMCSFGCLEMSWHLMFEFPSCARYGKTWKEEDPSLKEVPPYPYTVPLVRVAQSLHGCGPRDEKSNYPTRIPTYSNHSSIFISIFIAYSNIFQGILTYSNHVEDIPMKFSKFQGPRPASQI